MSERPAPRPVVTPSAVFALAFVALFGYLDWLVHRELAATIVLGLLAAGVILYRAAIVDALGLAPHLARMPTPLRPVLAAAPAVLYFLVRGQGTSGAGGIVLVSMAVVVGVGALLGPAMDRSLADFYRGRNRIVPRPVRMLLALVLPVLLAFLVIHGSLADLPALWGGTTRHPATPVGREGRFLLGTLLSAAVSWLLLREAPSGAAPVAPALAGAGGLPRPATAPVATPAATGWRPTHVVPATGLDAWAEPDAGAPAVTRLGGGVALQVAERRGEWARVVASNGWTGWVDARLLVDR